MHSQQFLRNNVGIKIKNIFEGLQNFATLLKYFLMYQFFLYNILKRVYVFYFAGLQTEVSGGLLLRSWGIAILRNTLSRQEGILVCRMPQAHYRWVHQVLEIFKIFNTILICLFSLFAGRCITAMFRKFHPEHFVCAFCLKQLNKGTFKEQNDKPYCHGCFDKLFG